MTNSIDNKRFANAIQIAARMVDAGVDDGFVRRVVEFAQHSEGVLDLMEIWDEEDEERADCVADLQELLDDLKNVPTAPVKKPYVPYDGLAAVVQDIRAHKEKLRKLIDRNGGVSAVARRSGIPQPSLSRMLNSGSMPRRSTLYKIANALDVPESDVVGEWVQ